MAGKEKEGLPGDTEVSDETGVDAKFQTEPNNVTVTSG